MGNELCQWARRSLRSIVATTVLISLIAGIGPARATVIRPADRRPECTQRILVLSAMPIELSPLLTAAKISRTVTVDHHDFFVGRLRGHDVILAMTRIGPANATMTTNLALRTFRCGSRAAISAALFSGVAGGDYIGNVAVPARWTLDNGKTWLLVDRQMLAAARTLLHTPLPLERKTPVGDPLCTCVVDPDTVSTLPVERQPQLEVGGDGQTTDPFTGRAIPCVPGDNDVFGCDPCPAAKHPVREAADFPAGILPFVGTGFFTGYLSSAEQVDHRWAAQDEETAAVARVLAARHIPFLAFRAVSDGAGDPLGLPGFPFQFLFYRQLSADNAAIATMAFLQRWHR